MWAGFNTVRPHSIVTADHRHDPGRCALQPGQVLLLAFPPLRFRLLVAVRARVHDVRHRVAKPLADLGQAFQPATVLAHIMQDRGDGFVLVAAVFENQAAGGAVDRPAQPAVSFRKGQESGPV